MSRPSLAITVLFVLLVTAPAMAQPCTGLCNQQVTCPNGGTTSISGTVFAPNGVDPLPNVLVYVPNSAVAQFSPTVTCDVAGPLASGSPLVETTTGIDGKFTLTNMPVGSNIPLVIQAGRWRRQITVSNVASCANTPVSAALTRFPRTKSEGDIPQIAIVTGGADVTECALRKIGISDSEFTLPTGNGRIHLYYSTLAGYYSGGNPYQGAIPAGTQGVPEQQLWGNQAIANRYAMTVLACPGLGFAPTTAEKNVFTNYLNAGGRVFATHFDYSWLANNNQYSSTADWHVGQPNLNDQTAFVNQTFTKGEQMAQWLKNVNPSSTLGEIPLSDIRHDQDGVNAPTQSWLSVNDTGYGNQSVQFTFNTPVGAPPAQQCGRVLFAEYHVEQPSLTVDPTGASFPTECTTGAMTPQEKLLEYALFDLSTFVAPDIPANVSASFVNPPEIFVQGDPSHTITINVTNLSPTIDTDHTLTLSVAMPNGLSIVSMADANGDNSWSCSSSTGVCSRAGILAHNATDAIRLMVSVAPDAPVGSGPVILTATVAGGGLAANVVKTDPITIKGRARLTWSDPASIVYGTALSATELNATASTDGTFNYVPPLGTVLAAGPHTLSVGFIPSDSVNYLGAVSSVTLIVDQATPVLTWAAPAPIVFGTALSGAQLTATADTAGSFAYDPAASSVLNAGAQTLSVTFTPDDAANYNGASATVPLTVMKATPTIKWLAPASIVYGTKLSGSQLNASTNVAGTFVYSPAANDLLNAGAQTLSVTFTPDDPANYDGAKATVPLTVLKATPAITWATPSAIVYGTALGGSQLNAAADVAGSFAYTPASGVLNAGSQVLTAAFTPTDSANYDDANAQVTLLVNKATPTITWSNPADIQLGTALSGTQLNATASVPGSFVYTPAAGSIPAAGTQILKADFTPADSVNYNAASKTVMLTVSTQPAQITGMPGIDCSIWPPNNKLVQVATISAGNAASFSVSATSNEPAAPGDIVITGSGLQPRTVQLRATRNGGGNGRVYTITATATNLGGLVTTQTAMCSVPHDSRK